ncbi:sugar-binding transcriptional regulator [Aurantimonas sp. VKM B-3413]|uniref:sugar-binding transcriptional regulator n=1 Tax=Aurantimonas sp. VKM B-3413 TaxID=2779401 RepID=UPI001E2B4F69|nr:sugar-binding transcriptional regulator [Aurantimonas sp. VKM B-3413]MCB8836398.1 sugar-binding transcriptional regulator [Aurantimonas sp. VKM B-3413]
MTGRDEVLRRVRGGRTVEDNVLEAAWLYYNEERNQNEIAERLGVSRATVVNYLQQARDQGLVELRLGPEIFNRQKLASALRDRFGLADVLVVPGPAFSQSAVALAAARYVPDLIERGDIVGIAWGQTIFAMAEKMLPRVVPDLTVVQMVGSMPTPYIFTAESCSTNVALKLSGKVVNLYAPAALSSPEAAAVLRAEPLIQRHFDLLERMRKAIFAVGSMSADSHVVTSGIATLDDLEAYAGQGAVGVVCGRFIDVAGRHVPGPIDERIIGITPDGLSGLSAGILVSSGPERVAAMRGAMIGGYVTHLVTDEPTAQAILNRPA